MDTTVWSEAVSEPRSLHLFKCDSTETIRYARAKERASMWAFSKRFLEWAIPEREI